MTQVRAVASKSTNLALLPLLLLPMLLLAGCGGDSNTDPSRDFEAWKAGTVSLAQDADNPETVLLLFNDGFFRLTAYRDCNKRLVGTWIETDGLYTLTLTEDGWIETDGLYTLTLTEDASEVYVTGVELFGRRTGDQMSLWGVDVNEEQAAGFSLVEETVVGWLGAFSCKWRSGSEDCFVFGFIESDGNISGDATAAGVDCEASGRCTPQGKLRVHVAYPAAGGTDITAQLVREGGYWTMQTGTWRDSDGNEGTVEVTDGALPPINTAAE